MDGSGCLSIIIVLFMVIAYIVGFTLGYNTSPLEKYAKEYCAYNYSDVMRYQECLANTRKDFITRYKIKPEKENN